MGRGTLAPMYSFTRRVLRSLGYADPADHREVLGSVTCPDPTLGTVTNPTGSLGGVSAADLTDAMSYGQDAVYRWQHWAQLSNFVGVAGRYRVNQTKAGEKWLLVIVSGAHEDLTDQTPVAAPVIGPEGRTFPIRSIVRDTDPVTGQPVYYQIDANWLVHDSRCRQTTTGLEGWSGSVTLTRADFGVGGSVDGSYDLSRGSDRIAGTFTAPRVVTSLEDPTCPVRASKTTCVS